MKNCLTLRVGGACDLGCDARVQRRAGSQGEKVECTSAIKLTGGLKAPAFNPCAYTCNQVDRRLESTCFQPLRLYELTWFFKFHNIWRYAKGTYGDYPAWATAVFGWLLCVLGPLSFVAYGFFRPLHLERSTKEAGIYAAGNDGELGGFRDEEGDV